jgi:hypothetical protein
VGESQGFNIHAGVALSGADRDGSSLRPPREIGGEK